MAGGVAGGFVAGGDQQDHEEAEFDLAHRVVVVAGAHQRGDDVLAWILPPVFGHVVGVAEQFGVGDGPGRSSGRIVAVDDGVDGSWIRARSGSGMPMRSMIACSGRWIATSSTKLPVSLAAAFSTIARAESVSLPWAQPPISG